MFSVTVKNIFGWTVTKYIDLKHTTTPSNSPMSLSSRSERATTLWGVALWIHNVWSCNNKTAISVWAKVDCLTGQHLDQSAHKNKTTFSFDENDTPRDLCGQRVCLDPFGCLLEIMLTVNWGVWGSDFGHGYKLHTGRFQMAIRGPGGIS